MKFLVIIRTFVCVVQLKGFSPAARELNIETSTVSRHVALLEQDLRVSLFNRSTRGLSLTEAGKLFYPRAVALLEQWEEARSLTSGLNERPAGLLRISMPPSFGRMHIMPHVNAFLQGNPDISLEILFSDELVDLIESSIDLSIRIGPLPDSTMHARRVASHHRYACAAPAWIAGRGAEVTMDCTGTNAPELLMLSHINRSCWYARRENTGDAWRRVPANFRFSCNDDEALYQACLQGGGIAILPDWLITGDLRENRLMRLFPDWEFSLYRDETAIQFVYPRKKIVASKVRSFIDFYITRIGCLNETI